MLRKLVKALGLVSEKRESIAYRNVRFTVFNDPKLTSFVFFLYSRCSNTFSLTEVELVIC